MKLRPPYRCGGSADSVSAVRRVSFCFPFNCAEMNIGTGTNCADCKQLRGPPYNGPSHLLRGAMSTIEDLADRVERLLLRHVELQRTHTLLEQQLAAVTHERDNLRSRLNAARSRIDALLERLPHDAPTTAEPVAGTDATGSAP